MKCSKINGNGCKTLIILKTTELYALTTGMGIILIKLFLKKEIDIVFH